MTTRTIRVRSAVALALLVFLWTRPTEAEAQATPPADAAASDMRPLEIQRLFDAYFVMEAQQSLGLTDAQYPPFLTRLRALQQTRRRHLQERARSLAELARMTAPRAPRPASDAAIRERLAALQELESRSAAENRKAYTELDALLEPLQQARFRVFEEQIERRKLELMLRARQNARQLRRPRQR